MFFCPPRSSEFVVTDHSSSMNDQLTNVEQRSQTGGPHSLLILTAKQLTQRLPWRLPGRTGATVSKRPVCGALWYLTTHACKWSVVTFR